MCTGMASAADMRRRAKRTVVATGAVVALAAFYSTPALGQVGLGSASSAISKATSGPVSAVNEPVKAASAPVAKSADPVAQATAPVTQAAAAAPVTQAAAEVTAPVDPSVAAAPLSFRQPPRRFRRPPRPWPRPLRPSRGRPTRRPSRVAGPRVRRPRCERSHRAGSGDNGARRTGCGAPPRDGSPADRNGDRPDSRSGSTRARVAAAAARRGRAAHRGGRHRARDALIGDWFVELASRRGFGAGAWSGRGQRPGFFARLGGLVHTDPVERHRRD